MSTPIAPTPVTTAAPSTQSPGPANAGEMANGQDTASPSAAVNSAAEEFDEITVDGRVERLSRAEIKRLASLAKGADKRFEESAKMRREAEALASRMRNPKDALELFEDPALGYDKAEVVQAMEDWYYRNVVQPSELSPEQRELAEAKERLRKYQEKDEVEAQRAREVEEAKMDALEAQKLQREIIELINESGLPKSKFTTSRIAYWMRVNEAKSLRAPKELIIQQVRKEARDIVNSMTQGADGDVLVNLLGDDTAKKLRKIDIDRIRASRQEKLYNPPAGQPRQVQADTPPKDKIDMREVKRRYREFR